MHQNPSVLTTWEERAKQERTKVYPFYYKALDLYMEAGKKVIVSEYP